jgi:hypothetical protein
VIVGDAVGEVVGILVGASVGPRVGVDEGDVVGLEVGDIVGVTVGLAVGLLDGALVGLAEGETVGELDVGDAVGANVQSDVRIEKVGSISKPLVPAVIQVSLDRSCGRATSSLFVA